MRKPGRPKGTTRPGIKYLTQAELKGFFAAVRKTKGDRRLRMSWPTASRRSWA